MSPNRSGNPSSDCVTRPATVTMAVQYPAKSSYMFARRQRVTTDPEDDAMLLTVSERIHLEKLFFFLPK